MVEFVCAVKPLFLPQRGIHSPLDINGRAGNMKILVVNCIKKKIWVHRSYQTGRYFGLTSRRFNLNTPTAGAVSLFTM